MNAGAYGSEIKDVVVETTILDFFKQLNKSFGTKSYNGVATYVSRIYKRVSSGEEQEPWERIRLVEADTVTNDIFFEEDKSFLDFVEKTRKKTGKEMAKELGISERSYWRQKIHPFTKPSGRKKKMYITKYNGREIKNVSFINAQVNAKSYSVKGDSVVSVYLNDKIMCSYEHGKLIYAKNPELISIF